MVKYDLDVLHNRTHLKNKLDEDWWFVIYLFI